MEHEKSAAKKEELLAKYLPVDPARRVLEIVTDKPYNWPLENASYDLVFSAKTLEYMEDLQSFMVECYRVIKPGGLTIHIASSTGPVQPPEQYNTSPEYTWHILKDGMSWLLRTSGFEVLEAEQRDGHPWYDCWGVGRKPL